MGRDALACGSVSDLQSALGADIPTRLVLEMAVEGLDRSDSDYLIPEHLVTMLKYECGQNMVAEAAERGAVHFCFLAVIVFGGGAWGSKCV